MRQLDLIRRKAFMMKYNILLLTLLWSFTTIGMEKELLAPELLAPEPTTSKLTALNLIDCNNKEQVENLRKRLVDKTDPTFLPLDIQNIVKEMFIKGQYEPLFLNIFKPRPYRLRGHTNWVKSVAITPDGTRAITGSFDKTAKLWDLRDPSKPTSYPLTGHTDAIWSVVITPNGTRAITGSIDNTTRLWDLKDPSKPTP